MVARHTVGALGLLALISSACTSLLGIDDAHFDPALEAGARNSGRSGAASGAGPTTSGSGGTGGGDAHDQHEVSDAGQASSAGGDVGTAAPALCQSYCEAVLASCHDNLEQYRNLGQCLEVCRRLPEGQPGDKDVNTVQCRLKQATFASSEPLVYCKTAGPLGQDRCGSNCDSYCALMQTTCTPASTAGNLEPSYYADTAACLSACAELKLGPDDPKGYSSSPTTKPSSYVGNNVYCRTYHVAAALEQSAPDEHCPHAMGGDPCLVQTEAQ